MIRSGLGGQGVVRRRGRMRKVVTATMAKSGGSEKTAPEQAPLAVEYATYLKKLPILAHEEGKFALLHHSDLAGVFETYQDALAAGYQKFGLKPFLVKQIAATENPVYLRT